MNNLNVDSELPIMNIIIQFMPLCHIDTSESTAAILLFKLVSPRKIHDITTASQSTHQISL